MVALRMTMEGRSRKEIAGSLGVDVKTVGRWLAEPAVQRELDLQMASALAEISAEMVSMTPEVCATLRELLHSQEERMRRDVCTWFLDRMFKLGGRRRWSASARTAARIPHRPARGGARQRSR